MAELLLGTAATGAAAGTATATAATAAAAGTAATSGLFGVGGAFSLGATVSTLGTVGGLMGGVGAFMSGRDQAALLKANQRIAGVNAEQQRLEGEHNALVLEQQTAYEKRLRDAAFKREQARRRTVMASTGASGLSDLEIMSGLATEHERDILALQYTGALQAQAARYGGQTGYNASLMQAGIYGAQARSSDRSAWMQGGASLLQGGAKAYHRMRGL